MNSEKVNKTSKQNVERNEWKRFFVPMAILTVTLVAITVFYSLVLYPIATQDNYFKDFLPNFFATMNGVVFSALFAGFLWFRQQNIQEKRQRERLIESLMSEVKVDLETLEKVKQVIEQKHEKINDILEYAKILGNYVTIPAIRKVAMEYVSRSENLLVINNLAIERQIAFTIDYINSFNNAPSEIIKITDLSQSPEQIGAAIILNRIILSTSFARVKDALEKLNIELNCCGHENDGYAEGMLPL